jgi:hypothetical protein
MIILYIYPFIIIWYIIQKKKKNYYYYYYYIIIIIIIIKSFPFSERVPKRVADVTPRHEFSPRIGSMRRRTQFNWRADL